MALGLATPMLKLGFGCHWSAVRSCPVISPTEDKPDLRIGSGLFYCSLGFSLFQGRGDHMKRTVGHLLVERLIDWGVEIIFGLPGDGVNGIFEGLRTHQKDIRFIQVRHEEAAAFAACGYAKYTGRLGVCIATSGPGGIHLLKGLYDAKCDGQPVLAITGHTYHD